MNKQLQMWDANAHVTHSTMFAYDLLKLYPDKSSTVTKNVVSCSLNSGFLAITALRSTRYNVSSLTVQIAGFRKMTITAIGPSPVHNGFEFLAEVLCCSGQMQAAAKCKCTLFEANMSSFVSTCLQHFLVALPCALVKWLRAMRLLAMNEEWMVTVLPLWLQALMTDCAMVQVSAWSQHHTSASSAVNVSNMMIQPRFPLCTHHCLHMHLLFIYKVLCQSWSLLPCTSD